MLGIADLGAVYTSLTDSEQVGGRYAMGSFESGYVAKVVDVEPGRRMSVDWGPTGVITWELDESAGRTRLTFVQSDFDDRTSVRRLGRLRLRPRRTPPLPRAARLATDLALSAEKAPEQPCR